jgi:hypothetical protein
MSDPDIVYRIVYPGGDRTRLLVATTYDYEEDEYDIASSRKFDDKDEATAHMVVLAQKHGLDCPKHPKLLD